MAMTNAEKVVDADVVKTKTVKRLSFNSSPMTSRIPPSIPPAAMRLPLVYVAPIGTITIVLPHNITIDIAVDKTVRMVCHDKFAVACDNKSIASAILHKDARIYQEGNKAYGNFYTDAKKTALITSDAVFFTMDHLKDAYVVSSNAFRGTSALSVDLLQFAKLDFDFTLRLFYGEAQTGSGCVHLCNEIVQRAHYEEKDGALITLINGFYIRQNRNGDVELKCRPRHIFASPSTGAVHMRTTSIDTAVQDDKAYVKCGEKRVHVSASGMVVSDGFCTTSMDHFGRIVSAS